MNLKSDIRDFILSGAPSDTCFDSLSLRVFHHQWRLNEPYRRLVEGRGADPAQVSCWQEIPAVSTIAFKRLRFCCGPGRVVFRTSGTTHAGALRGEHHLTDTDLYEAALRRQFQAYVLPDRARLRFISMTPSPAWLPDSSLGFMMADLHAQFGSPGSAFYLHPEGLDLQGVREAMAEAERERQPACVAGVASAFVQLLDDLAGRGLRYRLPTGSRIMDTGGFKGRSRNVERADLLLGYAEHLGVGSRHVVNEYGMTELGSQFYDASLLGGDPEVKVAPHWVRTLIIDPESGQPAAPGRPGLLRHIDLANLDSVVAVETEDLGRAHGDGFILLGRAAGAEPRGCSLLVQEEPLS